jgi:hypothetical protein
MRGGGQLNVDHRFDPILIVESSIIFRNSCRLVDRFLASKTNCRFVDKKMAMKTVKTEYFVQNQDFWLSLF